MRTESDLNSERMDGSQFAKNHAALFCIIVVIVSNRTHPFAWLNKDLRVPPHRIEDLQLR